jgi:hypothetical protein
MDITLDYQTDYIANFRKGSDPIIPEKDFAKAVSDSMKTVHSQNARTFLEDDDTQALRDCVMAVAEILYSESAAPRAGVITSESNSSYSYRVKEGDSTATVEGEIDDTVRTYLWGTSQFRLFKSKRSLQA